MAGYAAPTTEEPAEPTKPAAVDLPSLDQRIEWFDDWEEKTRESRNLSRRDRQYYDGVQWTKEEIAELIKRGQPVITKNRIARKINFIRGEEIKKRVDPVARPRTPQHEDAARAATDALRYVEEEQEFDNCRSAVMANVLVEGYGGAIKSIGEDGKHELAHIEWDRLFADPHSRRSDYTDAKYLGLVIWRDLDDAILDYPDAEEALREALTHDLGSGDDTTEDVPRRWADKRRKRVKICEMYFRIGNDWYRSDFTKGADLRPPERTAYLDERRKHSVCPLKMASCYIDSEGMRYGAVRALISPQDEINKRSSKALHLLSVKQIIAERDTIRDPHNFRTELAKPDGHIEVEPGALSEGRIQIVQNLELAQSQVMLLQEAKADIDSIGPSSATLPDIPESASGRAFIARQQAAAQELGPVFDSLRRWTHQVFELDWLCIRQFWTEEKWLRVTDDQELTGYRFVALNEQTTRAKRLKDLLDKQVPLERAIGTAAGDMAPVVMKGAQQYLQQMGSQLPPEQAQQALPQLVMQHPLMQQPIVANQVEKMLVDIVIDEAPETAILAQEEFQTLTELLPTIVQSRPDMAPTMAKLVVKASQLPNKRELLQELDKGPDPQAQQQQQAAQELEMAGAKAGVAVQESQAQLNQARAASEQAKTQMAGAKVPSEIEKNQAQAMRDAASAGAATGAAQTQPQDMQ